MGSVSEELRSPAAFAGMIQQVLDDALARFASVLVEAAASAPEFSAVEIISFKQGWPDGSCGFGGLAAQVLTDAQTVVALWREGNRAAVYIAGTFAYFVENPSPAFWEAVAAATVEPALSARVRPGHAEGARRCAPQCAARQRAVRALRHFHHGDGNAGLPAGSQSRGSCMALGA